MVFPPALVSTDRCRPTGTNNPPRSCLFPRRGNNVWTTDHKPTRGHTKSRFVHACILAFQPPLRRVEFFKSDGGTHDKSSAGGDPNNRDHERVADLGVGLRGICPDPDAAAGRGAAAHLA